MSIFFLVNFFSGQRKRSANQRKKNQNSVYRVKLSPHAKIQLLLNTFKNGRKIKGSFLLWAFQLYFLSQIMSIEDVERIMDETREGIEYQRVSDINWKALISAVFNQMLTKILIFFPQEIDELLSGSLTQEDEDAVLQELEEMTKVCTLYLLLSLFSHQGPWSWAAEWEWGCIDDTRGTKPTSFPGSLFFPSFIAKEREEERS